MANKAYEIPGEAITLVPATSFEDKRYTFVTVDASGNMVTPGAGVLPVGVVQIPAIANEPARVMTSGVSFIKLGDTVAVGASVETDANGAAITASTGKVRGVCLVGGTAGQIGCIQLI